MMKNDSSVWRFPQDWLWILGWHFVVLPAVFIAALFFHALSAARQGDPGLLYFAVGLAMVGVVLLFFARLPLYRQRRFFAFGPRDLPVHHRKLYWTAYAFIGTALGIMVLLRMWVE